MCKRMPFVEQNLISDTKNLLPRNQAYISYHGEVNFDNIVLILERGGCIACFFLLLPPTDS